MNIMQSLCMIAGAYGVGSIPTGYLIARMRGIADIRQHGSGNIGATNVARFLGWPYFFLVFVLDVFKAYGYLAGVKLFTHSQEHFVLSGLFLLLGNAFPWHLGFRGGKGVAVTMGILLALNIKLLCYCLVVWATIFAVTRTVGIASVGASIVLPCIAWPLLCNGVSAWLFTVCVSALVTFLHRNNVYQFLNGLKS